MKLIRYEHPTFSDLDKLFSLNFPSFGRHAEAEDCCGTKACCKAPNTDVHEDEQSYAVTVELPGIRKDEIDLNQSYSAAR